MENNDLEVSNAIRSMLSSTDGLEGQALRNKLTTIVNGLSIEASGNKTVLWAGYYDVAKQIAEIDDPNIRVLNKTVAQSSWLTP